MQSAKLGALGAKNMVMCQRALCAYVPCMLMCSRANVPCMLTCQCSLHTYVATCQRGYVLTGLVYLRASMPTCHACLHTHVSMYLVSLHAHVPTCYACLCAHVPTYSFDAAIFSFAAIVAEVVNAVGKV